MVLVGNLCWKGGIIISLILQQLQQEGKCGQNYIISIVARKMVGIFFEGGGGLAMTMSI